MTEHELDPHAFIGCGLTMAEWVQLNAEERTAFARARDELTEYRTAMLVDMLAEAVAGAAENLKLHALVEKAAKEVGA